MRIGLVPGSFKPLHAGHDAVIRLAAKENDKVKVFVSLSDRKRPGEIPILGSDMKAIWKGYIEPSLPGNVQVVYVQNPVKSVWEEVGNDNTTNVENTYRIYSDPEDLAQNYPKKSLIKYAGNLYSKNQIIPRAVQRTETVDVSGTKMRQYIETGDEKSFIKNLPKGVNGKAIWDILSQSAKTAQSAGAQPARKNALKKASAAVPTQKAKPTKKKTTRSEAIDLIKSFIFESLKTS
jgi:cytidyltransferase-like protein